MISIKDFTKQELINAIANWMVKGIDCETHLCDAADDLKSGKWLDYYNEKLANEVIPHSNS